MTQRRKSKKTEAETAPCWTGAPFWLGAGAAACVGAGLWLRSKKFSKRDKTGKQKNRPLRTLPCLQASGGPYG